MKWLEYMEAHPDEHLSFCSVYVSDISDGYALIVYDGTLEGITTPDGVYSRSEGTLTDEVVEQFARTVNFDYDLYVGYTDFQIAIFAMHEVGCASCPYKDGCEAMQDDYV